MKIIISALVGAIILFAWYALSWTVMGVHAKALNYTEGEDEIMEVLNIHLEEGVYYTPFLPPDHSPEDMQEYQKNIDGQPTAFINYSSAHHENMGVNMLIGFLLYLVASLVASFAVAKGRQNLSGFGGRFMMVLGIGLAIFALGVMPDYNWWSFPVAWIVPEFIDTLVGFSLMATWMAWYWGRQIKTT